MKVFLRWLVRLLYGFWAENEAVLRAPGPVLLLPNHLSWWDWVFIGVCLEDDWRFVTSSTTAEFSWMHKRIMVNRRTFPVDMNSPYAVKHMAEYLQRGGRLVLFPEGRISCTGSLMKLFDGTGFLILKTHPKVVTAYIRRAGRLPFSRNPNRKEWFPRVSVHFSQVLAPPALAHTTSSEGRARLTEWLRRQMMLQQFETELRLGPATVPEAILQAARKQRGKVILQDISLKELTYGRLLTGAHALASRWQTLPGPAGAHIGVLLPNVNAMPVVLLSLWFAGKIPAILNYSAGPATLLACARLASLKQVITSRAFLSRAKLDLEPLRLYGIEFLYLEDVRAEISGWHKLRAALRARFRPSAALEAAQAARGVSPTEDPAVILFTSGSEGEPKGVELTHRNLMANVHQILAIIDLMDEDRFFTALPLFHSYGLTISLLLPLTRGNYIFLYPSPLHYRVVPSALYNLNCTVLLGTNTFLMGYARKAHPYDFRSLRYLFAGGEKVQEATSTFWMRQFGVRILEGYGTTECSPLLSVNLPMRPRHGSVGQFLPGVEYRLEPVEGIEEPGPHESRSRHVIEAGGRLSELRDAPAGTQPADHDEHNEHDAHDEEEGFDEAPVCPHPYPVPGPGHPHGAPSGQTTIGRLLVRGPNVMRGYLNPEPNARFQAMGGWYDTGDIAWVDGDGFVHLLGRLKRFAKISGEMVSLSAVEEALAGAFPEYGLRFAVAILARPDPGKGEKLIVVTNESKLTLRQVRQAIRARGLGNLAVPRELKVLHDLPRLGTGKVDLRELERTI